MMRTLAVALAAALLLPGTASAETVDLATIKCADMAEMGDEDARFLFAWMFGFHGGQNGTTTLDVSKSTAVGKKIGEYCAANPDVGLLSAAMEAMSE